MGNQSQRAGAGGKCFENDVQKFSQTREIGWYLESHVGRLSQVLGKNVSNPNLSLSYTSVSIVVLLTPTET